jgi:hypothetical protein
MKRRGRPPGSKNGKPPATLAVAPTATADQIINHVHRAKRKTMRTPAMRAAQAERMRLFWKKKHAAEAKVGSKAK